MNESLTPHAEFHLDQLHTALPKRQSSKIATLLGPPQQCQAGPPFHRHVEHGARHRSLTREGKDNMHLFDVLRTNP